jgi:hypothetical protein
MYLKIVYYVFLYINPKGTPKFIVEIKQIEKSHILYSHLKIYF